MSKFSTLLVANRGEIALRVMRSARAVGLRTVAVYSDADADSLHVKYADEAVHIGPSPVGESYLRGDKIISAALVVGAQAIHPGYGFLSENSAFAEAVAAAGLIFVGPGVKAIEVMGDKAISKRTMIAAGVPCMPGYHGVDQCDETLIANAESVGFPLMVKAVAGGGGRGMRLVAAPDELASAIVQARSEAQHAFGSGQLIIEKAMVRPRHVEIQVFADSHGNVIHLGERDCSVQRRHQKVIEEAPCPVMTPSLRKKMGESAVEAARAVDYVGAGTVEFLLDESGDFYFLEMNTRLQVEHPVTEMVTGLDLVRLQLQVAQGEPLGIDQSDIKLTGHAIEVRLYAEDPDADFLPSTGPVKLWHLPEGEGIRVDTGVESGGEVSPFYDPMIAKVIAHGASRDEARLRLIRALEKSALFGTKTNRNFLLDALEHAQFSTGAATTAFIAEAYCEGYNSVAPGPGQFAAAAVLQYVQNLQRATEEALGVNAELLEWSSAKHLESVVRYDVDGKTYILHVFPQGNGAYHVVVGDERTEIKLLSRERFEARISINGRFESVVIYEEDYRRLHLAFRGCRSFAVTNVCGLQDVTDEQVGGGAVVAPMHGCLLSIEVTEGDEVSRGDKLAVMEAMKMQHEITATIDGVVVQVAAAQGNQLAAGDFILLVEPFV